jgi:hypothetical protein
MVQLWYFIVAAIAGGVLAGVVEPLSEHAQHVVEGVVIGGVFGLVLEQWIEHRGRLKWKSVKVAVPLIAELEFGIVEPKAERQEREFSLTEGQRQVGWRIYVQLVSRVATQPVAAGSGTLRGSLQSYYTLMQTLRDDLRDFPPGAPPGGEKQDTVETVTCWILNAVRALLAKWHQPLKDYEDLHKTEKSFPDADACLLDLERTRRVLTEYATVLSEILEVNAPDAFRTPSAPR